MALNADSKFPNRRAFVVKLRSDASPGELRGRIENLLTCEQREFSSAPELIAHLEAGLDAATVPPARPD
jgi:hypothetical protein